MVAHLVWDQGVAGSSPVFPTKFLDSSAVEPSTVNRVVVGSNPSRGAKKSLMETSKVCNDINTAG